MPGPTVLSSARLRLILRRIGSGFYGRPDVQRELAARLVPKLWGNGEDA